MVIGQTMPTKWSPFKLLRRADAVDHLQPPSVDLAPLTRCSLVGVLALSVTLYANCGVFGFHSYHMYLL